MDRSQEKRQLLEELLKEDYAFVHIHSRTPGISLPLDVLQSEVVTLKLSYNFSGKMTLGADCIEAELRFGTRVYHCKIPWQAVWGMSALDERRFVWPDEVPQSLAQPQDANSSVDCTPSPVSSVATGGVHTESSETLNHSKSSRRDKPPVLKRVK